MRNGQTLEGTVGRMGDYYYVTVPEGVIRLKDADVEFYCRTIEEAYQRKRAAIQVGDVEEHLRLAQWCQKQGLISGAAAELADARKADPTHPLIDVFQLRLQMAAQPASPQPALPARRLLSLEELNRTVRGLPPGSVETFTQTIQPLLMNNCAVGVCHGTQAEKLGLLRVPLSGPPGHRLTQRNLHEVLQWIDPRQPDASPLLTAPLQPHGTARTAIFNEVHAAQYRRLVDWVHEVTPARPVEAPATVGHREKPLGQAVPADADGFAPREPQGSGAVKAQPQRKPHPAPVPRKQYAREKPSPVQMGPSVQPLTPAAPMEPDVFDRRFLAPPAPARDGN